MRIMEITGCEKGKLAYSEFCADNDLPDCFSTIVYFMDTQDVHIGIEIDFVTRTYGVQYTAFNTMRIHKRGGFDERVDAELFIAQEAFNHIEKKGVRSW
jgi:hypothetical protein